MDSTTSADRLSVPKGRLYQLAGPVRRFLKVESASGIALVICAAVALILANSPAADAFHHFWDTPVVIGFGPAAAGNPFYIAKPLHFWINDALMVLFFFVVGLEIKREIVAGELSSIQKAALPVVGALGGMIAPAAIYLALEHGTPGERGWGVPMATDIAFVVGVLAVCGPRVPFGLKIFLLSLAIADDIGAILVIALAYSGAPDFVALGAAGCGFAFIYGLNRLGVRTVGIYLVAGAGIWLAVLHSGIHPTIAGVLLGLLTPSTAWVGQATLRDALSSALGRVEERGPDADDLQHLGFAVKESVSPLERLVHHLHPWVAFLIMPLFALSNAGVAFRPAAMFDPVSLAVIAGLVIGKPLGIFGFSFLAVQLGIAKLPTGVNWRLIAAGGCLGGIGFTMSLFVANLGLPENLLDAGKSGILLGSGLSALMGTVLLMRSISRPNAPTPTDGRSSPPPASPDFT